MTGWSYFNAKSCRMLPLKLPATGYRTRQHHHRLLPPIYRSLFVACAAAWIIQRPHQSRCKTGVHDNRLVCLHMLHAWIQEGHGSNALAGLDFSVSSQNWDLGNASRVSEPGASLVQLESLVRTAGTESKHNNRVARLHRTRTRFTYIPYTSLYMTIHSIIVFLHNRYQFMYIHIVCISFVLHITSFQWSVQPFNSCRSPSLLPQNRAFASTARTVMFSFSCLPKLFSTHLSRKSLAM